MVAESESITRKAVFWLTISLLVLIPIAFDTNLHRTYVVPKLALLLVGASGVITLIARGARGSRRPLSLSARLFKSSHVIITALYILTTLTSTIFSVDPTAKSRQPSHLLPNSHPDVANNTERQAEAPAPVQHLPEIETELDGKETKQANATSIHTSHVSLARGPLRIEKPADANQNLSLSAESSRPTANENPAISGLTKGAAQPLAARKSKSQAVSGEMHKAGNELKQAGEHLGRGLKHVGIGAKEPSYGPARKWAEHLPT